MIEVSSQFIDIVPNLQLGVLRGKTKVEGRNEKLWSKITEYIEGLHLELEKSEIKLLPRIADSRFTYKRIGKNPDRYPISSEALLKRIMEGKSLYQINNIVDVNNYISIRSKFSIGIYDLDQLKGNIIFKIGTQEDSYESLGKGKINTENLPILCDALGAFGSPTSDSKRTCITDNTKKIIMILMSFSDVELQPILDFSKRSFINYAMAEEIVTKIVTT